MRINVKIGVHACVQTDPFTLSAWILSQQRKTPQARGNLTMLLNAVGVGCKYLSNAVRRAGIAGTDVLGKAGTSNVQGEDQVGSIVVIARMSLPLFTAYEKQ